MAKRLGNRQVIRSPRKEDKQVTDQGQGLTSEIGKVVHDKLRTLQPTIQPTKPSGPESITLASIHSEHPVLPRSTALQSIAQQISRLSYYDMMLFARSLHHQNDQVLAEHPVEIADLLHGWALKELEASSTASG
jgi:hypothetical protein